MMEPQAERELEALTLLAERMTNLLGGLRFVKPGFQDRDLLGENFRPV
jgi:hypothetical protein